MDYQLTTTEEVVGNFTFVLHQIESFERAVDQMYAALENTGAGFRLEELCPYFGVLWPGSRVLARWVLDQGSEAFAQKRVLELGCGLALPSFVASRLGAQVIASDSHPDVPVFLARNLARNQVDRVGFRCLDWSKGFEGKETFDWILASDILYDRRQTSALTDFLDGQLQPGGKAVILDPDRSYWPEMVALARKKHFQTNITRLPPIKDAEPKSSILISIQKI